MMQRENFNVAATLVKNSKFQAACTVAARSIRWFVSALCYRGPLGKARVCPLGAVLLC